MWGCISMRSTVIMLASTSFGSRCPQFRSRFSRDRTIGHFRDSGPLLRPSTPNPELRLSSESWTARWIACHHRPSRRIPGRWNPKVACRWDLKKRPEIRSYIPLKSSTSGYKERTRNLRHHVHKPKPGHRAAGPGYIGPYEPLRHLGQGLRRRAIRLGGN